MNDLRDQKNCEIYSNHLQLKCSIALYSVPIYFSKVYFLLDQAFYKIEDFTLEWLNQQIVLWKHSHLINSHIHLISIQFLFISSH